MKNATIATHDREAHWQATRAELESIQRRGNLVTTAGLALLCVLLWADVLDWRQITWSGIFWTSTTLAIVAAGIWFVVTRRRKLAESHGLICGSCSYRPHDTEIADVIETRACPRCGTQLGH
jgi:hypothetical protein